VPDAGDRYTSAEKRAEPAPICPQCGGPGLQDWLDATTFADGREQMWIKGLKSCPTWHVAG
jgi:hypothetical protein